MEAPNRSILNQYEIESEYTSDSALKLGESIDVVRALVIFDKGGSCIFDEEEF